MSALPTRRDEDYRYADLAALEPLWPVAVERIVVAAGESGAKAIVLDAPNDVARARWRSNSARARNSTCACSTPAAAMAGSR